MSRRYSTELTTLAGLKRSLIHDRVGNLNIWWGHPVWHPLAVCLAFLMNATWENAGGSHRFKNAPAGAVGRRATIEAD